MKNSASYTTTPPSFANSQACVYSQTNHTLASAEKTYRTITVGTQTWLAENLAWLPAVNNPSDTSIQYGKYYVYGYSNKHPSVDSAKAATNYTRYGALYNWAAAQTACPVGWSLPETQDSQLAFTRLLTESSTSLESGYFAKSLGHSVRCIMD